MVKLVQVVLAREDRPVGEHFSQNAALRPDADGLGVVLGVKYELWDWVLACGHTPSECQCNHTQGQQFRQGQNYRS